MEKKATKRITIKTPAQAYAYLEAAGFSLAYYKIENDHVCEKVTCSRCGGAGYYPTQFHGACYECGGNPPNYIKRTPIVSFAKACRRSELARNRRQAKNEARQAAYDAERTERRAPFDAEFPGVRDALAPFLPLYDEAEGYNVAQKQHRILNDMAAKLEKYGSISEKAVAFAQKMLADEAAPKATLEEGRREITGRVLSGRWYSSQYGETCKFTLDLGDGTRVFGSVPAALQYSELGRRLRKGDTVALTATIERSEKDTDFGFYKRPSKARLVEAAPEDAPEAIEAD